MAGTSLISFKLPTQGTDPADAARKDYVDAEIARTAASPGAGLVLNADGKTFDVVAADGSIIVGADNITVGVIQTANIADGAVGNLQSSVTIGGLNNVNISADAATAGQAIVFDGLEYIPQDVPVVDMTTPPGDGDTIVWDPTGGTGGTGGWVPGPAASTLLPGAGLVDTAGTWDVVAGDASLVVTADAITVGPKGITTAHLADGAVGNLQSSVTLGGLNNVNISVDAGRTAGDLLSWGGAEWSATAAPVPVDLSNLVTLDTAQTLLPAAIKTFGASPIVPTPAVAGEAANKDYVDTAVSLVSGQNEAVGIFDSATDTLAVVFAGADVSFVQDSPLPAAAAGNAGSYVIANGSGSVAYPTAEAGDWIISDGALAWTVIPLSGGYLTSADSPVGGVISGSYSSGFQIVDGSVISTDLAFGAVDNAALGAQLGALTDVVLAGVSNPAPTVAGVGLVWNGAQWGASSAALLVDGVSVLDDLVDVDTTTVAPVAGDHLVFVGPNWAPAAAGVAVQKFAVAVGDGAALTYPVAHGLNTTDVTVQAWQGMEAVNVGVSATDANTVTVSFDVAPAAGAIRVVVVG